MSLPRMKKYPVRRVVERGPLGLGWRVHCYIVMRSGEDWESVGPFWFLTRAGADDFAASADQVGEDLRSPEDKVQA